MERLSLCNCRLSGLERQRDAYCTNSRKPLRGENDLNQLQVEYYTVAPARSAALSRVPRHEAKSTPKRCKKRNLKLTRPCVREIQRT